MKKLQQNETIHYIYTIKHNMYFDLWNNNIRIKRSFSSQFDVKKDKFSTSKYMSKSTKQVVTISTGYTFSLSKVDKNKHFLTKTP